MSEDPNVIRVRLLAARPTRLGLCLGERAQVPRVVIKDLAPGGEVEKSGLVHKGDSILRLNGVDVCNWSHEQVQNMLKDLPEHSTITLLLKGPECCTTYLQTIFTKDGQPKTVRVTTPILRNGGTPARSPSPGAGINSPIIRPRFNGWMGSGPNTPTKTQHTQTTPGETILQVGFNSPKIVLTDSGGGLNQTETDSPKIVLTESTNDNRKQAIKNNKVYDYSTDSMSSKTTDGKEIIGIEQKGDELTVVLQENKNQESNNNQTGAIPLDTYNRERRKASLTEDGTVIPGEPSLEELHRQRSLKRRGSTRGSRKNRSPSPNPNRLDRRRSSVMSDKNSPLTSPRKHHKTRFLINETVMTDTLHQKSIPEATQCNGGVCLGSLLTTPSKRLPGSSRPKEEVLLQAKDFLDQYYTSIKRYNTPSHQKRWTEARESIEKSGTYDLMPSELTFGAKTAWRNAPRCIGRIQWSKLQVFDARHIKTARGMFEALCNHIKYGTNKGNIRSAITIFPARSDGQHDFRVWNALLIRYAGYKQQDGSIIGDPASVEFTEICRKMGWTGNGGMYDVLPLVLQANGNDPELFEIPPELILEVAIKHPNPKYAWLEEMGIKWYALPAVSGMMLDVGGLEFTAIPFNGWYMGTEIGARDLCDQSRYNLLEPIAKNMGLETQKSASLWKDAALLEVNIAVLYSFQQSRCTITDHHSASESFMKHLENENRLRGGCPADWVWIVPPMSGSITPVFHQEMLRYDLKPSYEYQEDPWKTYIWKKDREKKKSGTQGPRRKIGFKELARAVKFSAKLMGKALAKRIKCTILYATETGKSETYAKRLCEIFKHAFDAKVVNMEEYDITELEHEAFVLVVTSTFGNGDPPENGLKFAKELYEMIHPTEESGDHKRQFLTVYKSDDIRERDDSSELKPFLRMESLGSPKALTPDGHTSFFGESMEHGTGPLANVRFSVFGLGSRAYPNFCAFARLVNRLFRELGAERIFELIEGDELCGQEQAFQTWANGVFLAACDTFCVGDDIDINDAVDALTKTDLSWAPGRYRLTPVENNIKHADICKDLSAVHHKNVFSCNLISRQNLQSKESPRQTILLKMDQAAHASDLAYQPGDHLAIFPANRANVVDAVLEKLHNSPPHDQLVQLEVLKERQAILGPSKSWCAEARLPAANLRTVMSRFLDITTPPSPVLLQQLASLASDEKDSDKLLHLATDSQAYEDWKFFHYPNIAEVLCEFPSLRVSPTFLLSQLPLLQPRFYSISSSPKMYPGEIHATVAVVSFTTQGGNGPLHHGVCSSWLNSISEGDIIPCFVRSAPSFHLPENACLPVVMVGPGTGVAPFRGFWQQRQVDRDMLPPPTDDENKSGWGEMTLYFGCRRSAIDHIYAQETAEANKTGALSKVFTALSREPGLTKTYVQDLLMRTGATIYHQIVKEGGHFYVCGDVSMAQNVCDKLEQILMLHGNFNFQKAKSFIIKLRENNRFHEDIFGVTLRTSEVQDQKRDEARKAWVNAESARKSVEKI